MCVSTMVVCNRSCCLHGAGRRLAETTIQVEPDLFIIFLVTRWRAKGKRLLLMTDIAKGGRQIGYLMARWHVKV